MKFLRHEKVPNDRIINDLGDMRSYRDQASDEELIEDIKQNGVHNPILLRPHPSPRYEGMYQLVDGRRRFQCNKDAGNNSIPADIWKMTDLEADRTALSRNIQRENPDPFGLGFWLNRIMEKDPEIKYQKDLAKYVNKSEAWVSNILTAYNEALKALEEKDTSTQLSITPPTERHARALRNAPREVKNRVIEITRNGPWPSSREIERMTRARMTPKEFLEQIDPASIFDDAFLAYRLSNHAGLTAQEAQETVKKWRSHALPWQSSRKTVSNSEVKLYNKLSEIYPTELIDLIYSIAPAKTFPTMRKYCRKAIYLLLSKTSEEIKQKVLTEIKSNREEPHNENNT